MLLVVSFAAVADGCDKVPPEYRAFLELPMNRRHEEMKKLPPDKQLEYYFAGLNYLHPPAVDLAHPIAEEGEGVLPFLLMSLRKENDESRKADIISIIEVMHTSYYRLTDKQEVISVLKETTAHAKTPRLKMKGKEAQELILEGRIPDPLQSLEKLGETIPDR